MSYQKHLNYYQPYIDALSKMDVFSKTKLYLNYWIDNYGSLIISNTYMCNTNNLLKANWKVGTFLSWKFTDRYNTLSEEDFFNSSKYIYIRHNGENWKERRFAEEYFIQPKRALEYYIKQLNNERIH